MNQRIIFILLAILTVNFSGISQKIYTKNGAITFFSKATLENISAENNQVMSILTLPTGELQFSVLIKSFHFKKSLMEEHFNENYMESDKYPKATFKGKINDLSKVNFATDGVYTVQVSGVLNLHGITNKTSTTGSIIVKSGAITATSKFQLKLADYKISIPKIVKDNISEVIDVTVSCVYDQKI
jgi:hypothetical protein